MENAYAKVNLHLEILNKRDDGYHNIFSIMLSAEESDLLKLDDLEIYHSDRPVEVEIVSTGGRYGRLLAAIPVQANLISAAVKAYLRKSGKSGRVRVSVEKNIPAGAGLGGGSSDAAAMLRMLNSRLEFYNEKEMLKLAVSVGADVPYCLLGGYAICEGTGDVITRLEGVLDYWLLIANNNIHVDTAWAYKSLKRDRIMKTGGKDREKRKKMIAEGFKKNDISGFREILKNDFEETVFKNYPELAKIKKLMLDNGADYSTMTGSGSSIIGLFRDYDMLMRSEKSFKGFVSHLIVTRII